jgi:acetyl esterase/lipase
MIGSRKTLGILVAAAALGLMGCRVTDVPLWKPTGRHPARIYPVECIRDVSYADGPDADAHRHRLDLFLPRGKQDFPVVFLVHGGAWMLGDNRCCGLYSSIGEFLASQGIAAVLPNYRLSPGVKHPEHIRDVARAFAWAQRHIAEYGGRPDRMIVLGHSAGGHLAALLATDETYLKAEGLRTADIKGVVAVSGVYHIPPGDMDLALGGTSPLSFRPDEVAPVRGEGGWGWTRRVGIPGVPLTLNVFGPAFGDDPQVRADASPVNHVRPGLPPFLLLSAEHDLPTLPGMAEEFHRALLDQGCESQLLLAKGRNHSSIMFRACEPDDAVAQVILDFIRRHVGAEAAPALTGSPAVP